MMMWLLLLVLVPFFLFRSNDSSPFGMRRANLSSFWEGGGGGLKRRTKIERYPRTMGTTDT